MKKNAITFTQLAARLERAIHCDVGMHGLNILLYGWIAKHGRCSRAQFAMRKKADGEYWLSLSEAEHFSKYCGYDLTHD
ncbi:MAG: hypothetical protein II901_00440 [Paludibacteraceae bacterium]|nr:hypothetical protein [Paludibacteraceae bacterium]